ncbi:hypothetical protein HPB52_020286 [Rhipicephalus sanguineus]|uniref:Uncharacterized protein n=1 Tax=Rhipicephalus sanguineus TaxID=34632 RepID=A0A9D4Q890_RHISA|nr:hypothetical protein HPB52_020286 [Rhipicephalus sanguineus]
MLALATSPCAHPKPSSIGATVSTPSLLGLRFTLEPPHPLEFSNASGGELHCEDHGQAPPLLVWATANSVPATVVPGVCVLAGTVSWCFRLFQREPTDRTWAQHLTTASRRTKLARWQAQTSP